MSFETVPAGRVFAWHYDGTAAEHCSVRSFLKRHRFPKSVLSSLKSVEGAVLRDGKPVRLNELLTGGEEITVRFPAEAASEKIVPENIPLDILYEDADLLVVNKPPFLPVHSSGNHHEGTLANAAARHFEVEKKFLVSIRDRQSGQFQNLYRWADGWENYTPVFHCMNRLDRDTSGVIIITKSHLAAASLGEAIEAREVHREYLAVVAGLTEEKGTVDVPIGRDPDSVILRMPDPVNGQSAHTEYERIGIWTPEKGPMSSEVYSLLRIRLGTGRTHQIRIHMKYLGHPLPGDYLYDPDYRYFRRQPLHSYRMRFLHPVTGEPMEFTAPLPEDMRPAGAFSDGMPG